MFLRLNSTIWIFVAIVLFGMIEEVRSLPHLQKAFKCAGDKGLICESGLCYDALGFYESAQNVGCAPREMCTQVGCLMYKNVFTCCCANRFCNGKSELLMLAKYEMFKQNHDSWPTNLPPRIFARNITVSPKNPVTEANDVRLAPVRKTTTNASPTTAKSSSESPKRLPQTTTIFEQAKSIESPERVTYQSPTNVMNKGPSDEGKNSSSHQRQLQTSSTTTQIAVLPDTTTVSKPKRPLVIETEVKQPSSLSPSHSINDDEEKTVLKDNERTTRSYQAAQEAKATTTRPRKQRKEKEGVKVESVKATAQHREEVHHPKAFPWYAITIVGFIIASIVGLGVYYLIRLYLRRKNGRRDSSSIRNASSIDSSRVSSADGAAYPNERERETADPLLAGSKR